MFYLFTVCVDVADAKYRAVEHRPNANGALFNLDHRAQLFEALSGDELWPRIFLRALIVRPDCAGPEDGELQHSLAGLTLGEEPVTFYPAEVALEDAIRSVTACWRSLGLCEANETESLLSDADSSASALLTVLFSFFALFSQSSSLSWLSATVADVHGAVAEALLLSPLFARAAESSLDRHLHSSPERFEILVGEFDSKLNVAAGTTTKRAGDAWATAHAIDMVLSDLPNDWIPFLRWFDLTGVWHLLSTSGTPVYEHAGLRSSLAAVSSFDQGQVEAIKTAIAALSAAVQGMLQIACPDPAVVLSMDPSSKSARPNQKAK